MKKEPQPGFDFPDAVLFIDSNTPFKIWMRLRESEHWK